MITKVLNLILIAWPLIVSTLAYFFYRKQNSANAWTGGPISWPKSFWLAYTTTTWFVFPLILLMHPNFPLPLMTFFLAHLISWWIRGPLELVMIYRWFNWTPRYGISHDIIHILICGTLLILNWSDLIPFLNTNFGILTTVFACIIIFSTLAEVLFAVLFLNFRSEQEQRENIYFASDDPKWIFINRVTLFVVIIVMTHLLLQSFFVIRELWV
ncbi:MAG: hypothetical protein IPM97_12700 [Bdellovibrionaceae bacterium]|nr:hypothetical protein [Pseudobdellovibrionaceae bacterium]